MLKAQALQTSVAKARLCPNEGNFGEGCAGWKTMMEDNHVKEVTQYAILEL